MYTSKQYHYSQTNYQTKLTGSHAEVFLPGNTKSPLSTQPQALSNYVAGRFAQSCPQKLPSPGLCPFGGVCHTCPARVQTKLTINEPGDKYEQEANRIAEQVMRMPEPGMGMAVSHQSPVIQRDCSSCDEDLQRQVEPEKEDEETVQAKLSPGMTPETDSRLASQIQGLHGGGRPLPASARTFFEPRFGRDFSQVRIHDDEQSARTARSIHARAFTLGHHVVFGYGQHNPNTQAGKKLLAHELTHVVQQENPSLQSSRLQRQPAPRVRKDIVLLMSPGLSDEATVLAPQGKVINVTSADDMAKKLKAVNYPIKRLFIISHSLSSGDLGFESGNTTTFVRPSVLASKLTGTVSATNAPESIDFRGCSLGSSPDGMEKIRGALGAGSAIAGNCFMITHIQGPVAINSTKITQPSQVTRANRSVFDTGMTMLKNSFGKAKNCILDDTEQAYFRAKGKLVAQWASPHYGTSWDDRKSKCYKNLTTETVDPAKAQDTSPGLAGHCKLIKIEKKP